MASIHSISERSLVISPKRSRPLHTYQSRLTRTARSPNSTITSLSRTSSPVAMSETSRDARQAARMSRQEERDEQERQERIEKDAERLLLQQQQVSDRISRADEILARLTM